MRGGGSDVIDARANRNTVSIRVVSVGRFCVRAVTAIGYDPRLNQPLYRLDFDSGPMTSLGISAYENALQSARMLKEARLGLEAARRDAVSYRRAPSACS